VGVTFAFTGLVSGQRIRAYTTGRGNPGAGGSSCCGGHLCHSDACYKDFCPGDCCGMGQSRPYVGDAEGRVVLVERKVLEQVFGAEAETKWFAPNITLLGGELVAERRARGCLRASVESNLRSSPFCRPGAPSYSMPSSVPHRGGITCLRGCGLQPSATLRWPESLSCIGRRCLLSWSRCLGARPMTTSAWRLWVT
jgi:hypothetical protein